MKLTNLGSKLREHSRSRVDQALKKARELKGELKQIWNVPVEPVRFPVAESPPTPSSKPEPKLGNPDLPAQIYGRESCPWTGRARALLEREEVAFEYIDLDTAENVGSVSQLLMETKQNTNPYIFLRGHFIGGYKALDEIHRLGQLPSYLESAREHAQKPSRIRIEVASRSDHDDPPPGER